LNTANKVQEIYLKKIDEANEKIFYINNTMNEINRKTQTTQELYKKKNDEMANQFSGIDTSLYDLKTKIGIHRFNFRFNNWCIKFKI
jgi:Ni,Fe-hydrogenase I large subunit